MKAIIVDLDGTLCNCTKRLKETTKPDGKLDHKELYARVGEDSPNSWCVEIIEALSASNQIIFLTARPEKCRKDTLAWIMKHTNLITPFLLIHRSNGDLRKDFVVKEEIYRQKIKPEYEVLFCVDDRTCVVEMWRKLGLTCLQCAEGNF